MSDDYGSSIQTSDALALAGTAYAGYQAYNRMEPFVKGAADAFTGAQLGTMAAKVAGSTAARTALAGTVARTAAGIGIRTAIGAGVSGAAAGGVSGAAAGAAAGSIVPGFGTIAGAAIGAIAPLVIPHTPLAKPVRAIPIVGPWLSPKQSKKEEGYVGGETPEQPGLMSSSQTPMMTSGGGGHTMTGPEYASFNRAEYNSGRGFRR